MRVDVPEPPDVTVILVGLNDVVTPVGAVAVRFTVPENPPVLVTVIVDWRWEVANTLPRLDGLALIVKSAVA